MRTARITLGYDGTEFFGSQSQRGRRTVQSELQRAIDRVSPGSSRCILAGRTDKGVHAAGQTSSVKVGWTKSAADLRIALDAVTPHDIVIRHVSWAGAGFHARFDAQWREYRYRLVFGSQPLAHETRYVWWRRSPVDDDLVSEVSRQFVGEHSFGAFAGHGWSTTRSHEELVRRVRDCTWRRSDIWDEHGHRSLAEFRVVANGFLPQMVRNMVSAIVSVGDGSRPVDWIGELLATGNRSDLGEAAPPRGLTLWRVSYDEQGRAGAHARLHGEHEES